MRKGLILPLALITACLILTSCKKEEEPLDTSIYNSLQTSVVTTAPPKTAPAEEEETTAPEETAEMFETAETLMNDSDMYMVSGTIELSGNKLIMVSEGKTYNFVLADGTETENYSIADESYNAVVTYKLENDGKIRIISLTAEEKPDEGA